MRWRVSLLAGESLLVGATGWGGYQPFAFVPAWSHPKRPSDVSSSSGSSRGQHQLPPASMTAPAGGSGGGCGGGDGRSSWYNKEAWQRRASRAMKYVSMPIVKKAGQPREQVKEIPTWMLQTQRRESERNNQVRGTLIMGL